MANTQTTVPIFTAAQVLEAAQLNNSAATGVPVFANTTTRDAGFNGAGEKTLAEGQLCYLESTNVVQYYDGAAWATLGPAPAVSSGLTFITGGSLSGTATSINSCFSATYLNYKIVLNDLIASSGSRVAFRMRVGGSDNTTSNYTFGVYGIDNAASTFSGSLSQVDTTSFKLTTLTNVGSGMSTSFDMHNPFASKPTFFGPANCMQNETALSLVANGVFKATTSFDGITFSVFAGAETLTGSYKIYGYANS